MGQANHYSNSQKILLVGEGDFSFAACLARHFRSATNMVATSLDSRSKLMWKHWSAEEHVEELHLYGCTVIHGVDVHRMHKHPVLQNLKFDRIVFNFPHAGHYDCVTERDSWLIQRHQKLVSGFFRSTRTMLAEGGEVHVSHRDDDPYDTWDIVALAGQNGLRFKAKAEFRKSDYPGYHNKRGGGINSNKTFPLRDCSFTFKFSLRAQDNKMLTEA